MKEFPPPKAARMPGASISKMLKRFVIYILGRVCLWRRLRALPEVEAGQLPNPKRPFSASTTS